MITDVDVTHEKVAADKFDLLIAFTTDITNEHIVYEILDVMDEKTDVTLIPDFVSLTALFTLNDTSLAALPEDPAVAINKATSTVDVDALFEYKVHFITADNKMATVKKFSAMPEDYNAIYRYQPPKQNKVVKTFKIKIKHFSYETGFKPATVSAITWTESTFIGSIMIENPTDDLNRQFMEHLHKGSMAVTAHPSKPYSLDTANYPDSVNGNQWNGYDDMTPVDAEGNGEDSWIPPQEPGGAGSAATYFPASLPNANGYIKWDPPEVKGNYYGIAATELWPYKLSLAYSGGTYGNDPILVYHETYHKTNRYTLLDYGTNVGKILSFKIEINDANRSIRGFWSHYEFSFQDGANSANVEFAAIVSNYPFSTVDVFGVDRLKDSTVGKFYAKAKGGAAVIKMNENIHNNTGDFYQDYVPPGTYFINVFCTEASATLANKGKLKIWPYTTSYMDAANDLEAAPFKARYPIKSAVKDCYTTDTNPSNLLLTGEYSWTEDWQRIPNSGRAFFINESDPNWAFRNFRTKNLPYHCVRNKHLIYTGSKIIDTVEMDPHTRLSLDPDAWNMQAHVWPIIFSSSSPAKLSILSGMFDFGLNMCISDKPGYLDQSNNQVNCINQWCYFESNSNNTPFELKINQTGKFIPVIGKQYYINFWQNRVYTDQGPFGYKLILEADNVKTLSSAVSSAKFYVSSGLGTWIPVLDEATISLLNSYGSTLPQGYKFASELGL